MTTASDYQYNIQKQLSLLRSFFSDKIDADYVYLDAPGHMNVGDHLIALGAWELLKSIPYKCLLRSTIFGFNWSVPAGAIILLHGGGNFGDLYPGANWFRNEIVSKFSNHKIIFLPQTITYNNKQLIQQDAQICAHHKDLHICARDYESFQLLKTYFVKNFLYLLPDTAWGLYTILEKQNHSLELNNSLLISRQDSESNGNWDIKTDVNTDWNGILESIGISYRLVILKFLKWIGKYSNCFFFRKISDKYLLDVIYPFELKRTNNYFLQFNKVYTTRLHGLILSIMLHIPAEWYDTKYSKIKN